MRWKRKLSTLHAKTGMGELNGANDGLCHVPVHFQGKYASFADKGDEGVLDVLGITFGMNGMICDLL